MSGRRARRAHKRRKRCTFRARSPGVGPRAAPKPGAVEDHIPSWLAHATPAQIRRLLIRESDR